MTNLLELLGHPQDLVRFHARLRLRALGAAAVPALPVRDVLDFGAKRDGAALGTAAFQKAIYAEWGHKEVVDLLGAVDAAVAAGLADPARLRDDIAR